MSAFERVRRGSMTPTMCDIIGCYRTGSQNAYIMGKPAGSYCDAHSREFEKLFTDLKKEEEQ